MPYSITIPRLGWSMEEGTLSEWLKSPGEFVRSGDMLFMLEGEKAAQEIESLDSGYLCIPPDAPQPGATVLVGQVIGFLLAEGEAAPASVQNAGPVHKSTTTVAIQAAGSADADVASVRPANSTTREMSERVAGPASRRLARKLGIDINTVSTPDPTGRVQSADLRRAASSLALNPISTPRARRRAQELGLDWRGLKGSGRGGRIREQDVLAASTIAPTINTISEPLPTVPGKLVQASKLRRVIAQRMMLGIHAAAPVTMTTKVDASALIALRDRMKLSCPAGNTPSFNDILIGHTAQTLRELPELNACWIRDGVYSYNEIHIASAVDTPDGLLAPIVRHADRLSLLEIAEQTRQLIQTARTGQLRSEQLTGATFTITNLGMFGIDAFTPILNLPQAAILGIGRILTEPVVREGRLEVGQTLTLSLTFDHRVIDGAPAARWLQRLCEKIVA